MHVIPKETLKKPDRSYLELSAEMEPVPSLCMAECCSLWGRNGSDSGFGMHTLETWCLQHASATWKQCEVI